MSLPYDSVILRTMETCEQVSGLAEGVERILPVRTTEGKVRLVLQLRDAARPELVAELSAALAGSPDGWFQAPILTPSAQSPGHGQLARHLLAEAERLHDSESWEERWPPGWPTSLDNPSLGIEELKGRWRAHQATLGKIDRRYRFIRTKIFLRPDLFAKASSAATDASKLQGKVATLVWTREDIFRVLLRRMGGEGGLRAWLPEFKFHSKPPLGWMPPYALPEVQLELFPPPQEGVPADSGTQQGLASRFAGKAIGTGPNKGLTHRWILNHSMDGRGQLLPRVALNLIRYATQSALDRAAEAPGDTLVTPVDLEAAQRPTGEQRLQELRESEKVVFRLNHLRERSLPFSSKQEAMDLLAQPWPGEEDGYRTDGAAVLLRLIALGTLVERAPPEKEPDGSRRVDMPDLFKKALDARRKGGPLQLPRTQRR